MKTPIADFTGKLLIASPLMKDSNFHKTVILIVRHSTPEGAIGVVLNRTSDECLKSLWKNMWDLDVDPIKYDSERFMQLGGPVYGPVICVHANEESSEHEIVPGLYLATSQDNVLASVDVADGYYRIYQGYSGWAMGQLEREITRGAWMVEDSDPEIVFHEQHADIDLYKHALYKFGRGVYRDAGIPVPDHDVALN